MKFIGTIRDLIGGAFIALGYGLVTKAALVKHVQMMGQLDREQHPYTTRVRASVGRTTMVLTNDSDQVVGVVTIDQMQTDEDGLSVHMTDIGYYLKNGMMCVDPTCLIAHTLRTECIHSEPAS